MLMFMLIEDANMKIHMVINILTKLIISKLIIHIINIEFSIIIVLFSQLRDF